MDDRITGLYQLPDISQYEDVRLLSLKENCAMLEAQVYDILPRLSEQDRYVIEAYIGLRDDLEYETVKAALRCGKRYYP